MGLALPQVVKTTAPDHVVDEVEVELEVRSRDGLGDWLAYLTVQLARDSRFARYYNLRAHTWRAGQPSVNPGYVRGLVTFTGVRPND